MAEGDTHTIYSDSFVPLNELVTRLGTLLYRCLSCSGSFQSKEKRDLHWDRRATFITQMHKRSRVLQAKHYATSRDQ